MVLQPEAEGEEDDTPGASGPERGIDTRFVPARGGRKSDASTTSGQLSQSNDHASAQPSDADVT